MTRWGVVTAVCLALVAVGCGDDAGSGADEPATTVLAGSTTTAVVDGSAAASPLGPATSETVGFEVFADLPMPSGDTATADRPPLTDWDGSAVLIGPAGGLVRLDPEEGATVTPTEGIDSGDGTDLVRAVDLLASNDDALLAIGHEEDLAAEDEPSTRPVAWRSTDGDQWEQFEPVGFDYGTSTVTLSALAADPAGGFVLGGSVDDGEETTLAVWSSWDGRSWDEIGTEGLDHPESEDESEALVGLAVLADTRLVIREATGPDDSRLSIMRSTGGAWTELEPGGLDALDLANSDVLPSVTAIGDQFVMFASTPVDPDDEFGERTPTLFVSGDGEDWAAVPLDGPTLPDPFFVQAVTGTDSGAVAVAEGEDALNVWRFSE